MLPWTIAGGVNIACFVVVAVYLSKLDEGLFSDIARSAVIKIYALLATIWTIVLGFVIWLSPKLEHRTCCPLLTFFALLVALDIGMVTATNPGIWIALLRRNPYWSEPWKFLELGWLVGSTAVTSMLFWLIRSRSVAHR